MRTHELKSVRATISRYLVSIERRRACGWTLAGRAPLRDGDDSCGETLNVALHEWLGLGRPAIDQNAH